MIKRLIWTISTPMSPVLKKADKLNLSLSISLSLSLSLGPRTLRVNCSADLSSVKQFKIMFNGNLVKLHWPLLLILINLIPAWISNHIPDTMRDEINHPFPNFNGCAVEVWEWINNFIPHLIMDVITYPCWD